MDQLAEKAKLANSFHRMSPIASADSSCFKAAFQIPSVATKDSAIFEECRLLGCGAVWGLVITDVSEESDASIFRIEEITRERKCFFYPKHGGGTLLRNVGF
jgi:hypothetical protein